MEDNLDALRKEEWKKEIPQLADGTYDCDVFGGDYVGFGFDVNISGNISLGSHSHLCNIHSGGSVWLGDYANAFEISADDSVTIGSYSEIKKVQTNNGDICFGDFTTITDVFAGGNIVFGDNATVLDASAQGSISFGKDSDIFGDLNYNGSINFRNN